MSASSAVCADLVDRSPATGTLRGAALRSGAYLTVREAVGAIIRLCGLVLVMRRIGPAAFGMYGAAAAYLVFPTTLAQMGAEIFVVRQPGPLARRTYDEVFTALLATSGVVVASGLGLSFLVAPWLRPVGVVAPLRVLLFAVPINILWAPYQGCIERKFAYRRMGLLELGGDVALYGTAVPLALMGYGAWSLVAGFFAWQSWLLVGSMVLSGLRPRLAWSNRTVRALVAHGRTYCLTTWILGARSSVITLVVATCAGATGVGLVNFAVRLVATMNFTDRGVHRVGTVAISQANKDRLDRLGAALEEGMLLLLVVSALPLVVFGFSAHWVIPDVFGRVWLPALPVYVLLALWAMLRVPMTVQRTLLYARGRNVPPAVTSLIELVIVSLVSLVAVRELGIVGYGIASVVAVSSTVYTHCSARRLVPVRYRRLVVPLVALVPPVLAALVPLPWSLLLLLPLLLLVVNPATRQELATLWATARATIGRGERFRRAKPVATTLLPHAGHAGDGVDMALNGSSANPCEPFETSCHSLTSRGHDGPVLVAPEDDVHALREVVVPVPPAAPDPARASIGPAASRTPDRAGLSTTGAGATAVGELSGSANGSGVLDQLVELLVESDPVTGLPSAAVLLARLGRILGVACEPGWGLGLVALQLVRPGAISLAAPSEELLCKMATAIRGELRFDDIVARVGPRTFVVAVLLAAGGGEGSEVATHLESVAQSVLTSAAAPSAAAQGAPWAVRAANTAVPLPCEEHADLLVRQVVEAVRQ